jgi:hypothetical protein
LPHSRNETRERACYRIPGMERERTAHSPETPLPATYVRCPAAIVRNGFGGARQAGDEQLLPNYPAPYYGTLHFHGRVKEIAGVHAVRECGNSPARVAQTAEGGRALSERRESSHTQKNRSFTTDAPSRHIRFASCRNCEERPRRRAPGR